VKGLKKPYGNTPQPESRYNMDSSSYLWSRIWKNTMEKPGGRG